MSSFFPDARRPGCIVSCHQIGGSVTLSLSLFIEAYALNGPLQCTYKSDYSIDRNFTWFVLAGSLSH